ncbi:MAG: hypothetical protein AAF409_03525 [Pseudomonadota bacterium]
MRTGSFALILALLASPATSSPERIQDYDTCVDLVETAPEDAVRLAGEWVRYGDGGAGARHCYALALVAVGAQSQAVDELLDLAAEETELSAEARVDVLVQAGELLLVLEEPAAAGLAATEALRLMPNARSALALRGAVRVDQGDLEGGVADFNAALATGQPVARFLIRRAAARRILGALVAARDDAVFATEVDDKLPEAWLERGRVEARLGDKPAARMSLLEAIALDRDGETGRQAQLALQRMEVGVN